MCRALSFQYFQVLMGTDIIMTPQGQASELLALPDLYHELAHEGEEEQINRGLWGMRLAEYLVQKLSERGIKAEGIIAEDWGYYLPVANEGFKLAPCCGHQYGDNEVFLCFTDPATPVADSPETATCITGIRAAS